MINNNTFAFFERREKSFRFHLLLFNNLTCGHKKRGTFRKRGTFLVVFKKHTKHTHTKKKKRKK